MSLEENSEYKQPHGLAGTGVARTLWRNRLSSGYSIAEGVRIPPFMRNNNRVPASDNYFFSGKNKLKKNSRSETALFSIVDDDESMREAIESLIESLGFRAETFASTEEFVQCDHLRQIACLILDVHLPGMSGLELQRLLSFATYNFPIIFISGRGDDRMREYALEWGAVEFLYKPFTAQALLTAVHAALNR